MKTTIMSETGFIVFVMGGVGKRAGVRFVKKMKRLKCRHQYIVVYFDTDSGDLSDPEVKESFDAVVDLSLDPTQIRAIKDHSSVFGPAVEYIVQMYGGELVNEFESEAGSRTIRMLTLLAFAYYYPAILKVIHKATCLLMSRGLTRKIKPVFVSSSGGGAGSSLQVLLAYTFGSPLTRNKLRIGLPPMIHAPITAILAEPFALAQKHNANHANKILANCAATTIEMEALDAAYKPYEVIYHLGLTNSSGVILLEPDDIDRVLGNAILQIQMCAEEVASRRADTFETRKPIDRFQGKNIDRFGLNFAMNHTFVEKNLFAQQLVN